MRDELFKLDSLADDEWFTEDSDNGESALKLAPDEDEEEGEEGDDGDDELRCEEMGVGEKLCAAAAK